MQLANRNISRFRYQITTAGFTWTPGTVEVTFEEGSWQQDNGVSNLAETEQFTVLGPTAQLLDPPTGGGISVTQLNERKYFEVLLRPSGVKNAQITGTPANPTLSGPSGPVGTVNILDPPTLQSEATSCCVA